MIINQTIAIVGTGNMGEALVKGILQAGVVSKENLIISDIDRQKLQALQEDCGIKTAKSNEEAVNSAQIIILAVKPHLIGDILAEISSICDSSKLLISIAAGVSLKFIEEKLSKGVGVIRAMPNTPALIGAGISALSAGRWANKEAMEKSQAIFEAVGKVVVVEEKLMDAVTALSGCGPAYIFTLIEALSDAGVELGLNRQIALQLVTQTVEGSAKLISQTGEHPAILREKVTSPGGATIAGLHALEKHKFRLALFEAVLAAAKRAKELNPQEGN